MIQIYADDDRDDINDIQIYDKRIKKCDKLLNKDYK